MALISHLRIHFDSQTQSRGLNYFSRKKVRINFGNAELVEATVQGGSLYEASLDRENNTVRYYCSCPAYRKGPTRASHVWATLLAAEPQGYLSGTNDTRPAFRLPQE